MSGRAQSWPPGRPGMSTRDVRGSGGDAVRDPWALGKATYHNVNKSEQFNLRKTVDFSYVTRTPKLSSGLHFLSMPAKLGGDRTVNLVFSKRYALNDFAFSLPGR